METKHEFTQKELEKLNKNELCRMVLDMQEEVKKSIAASERQIDILTQEIKLLRSQRFGRKSEISFAQAIKDGQMVMECVFNETEAAADSSKEETVTVAEHKRKVRPKGKQKEDLSKLRKEEEHFRIDEKKLNEMFPNGYRELPDDVSSVIEHIPEEYYVKEQHVHVYCAKDDDSNIVRAEAPKKLFGKGLASPSLVAGIGNAKYTNALPLYRIEKEFERNNVPISRQTMANWIVMSAERYFSLLIDRLEKELFTHSVIHSDETPMLVTKDGRKAGAKSYMWVYRSNVLDENPVVIFKYCKTRSHTNPKEFLKDFKGYLVTDGYEAYHKLSKLRNGEITVCGCWVHANRKMKDAIKAMGKAGKGTTAKSIAEQAVKKMGKIFDTDNKFNEMTSEERLLKRESILKPLVDEFFEWIKKNRYKVTLKSKTGTAITYLINQEEYLREFLTDGDIPMENNAAERAIRPFVLGKKNWVMSDTIHGAESSSIIYSVVETAKANNLKPYEYMKYLLEEIPQHMDDVNLDFLDDLLPWSEKLPEDCHSVVSTDNK